MGAYPVEPIEKDNSVIDRLDSDRLVENGASQCRYRQGGYHQTAEVLLATPIIGVRNMDQLKEAPTPLQIAVVEEL